MQSSLKLIESFSSILCFNVNQFCCSTICSYFNLHSTNCDFILSFSDNHRCNEYISTLCSTWKSWKSMESRLYPRFRKSTWFRLSSCEFVHREILNLYNFLLPVLDPEFIKALMLNSNDYIIIITTNPECFCCLPLPC